MTAPPAETTHVAEPPAPTFAAVVFADGAAAVGLLERIRRRRRLVGAGFESFSGRLADRAVVAVTPPAGKLLAGATDFARVLVAVHSAFRPTLVIGAGFSARVGGIEAGRSLLASRVAREGSRPLELATPGAAEQLTRAAVFEGDRESAPEGCLASNRWSYAFAEACAEHSLAAAVVTTVDGAADASLSAEADNVWRRRSVAGWLGAAARAAWRRPTSLAEVAQHQSARWQSQERLADAIETFLAAC